MQTARATDSVMLFADGVLTQTVDLDRDARDVGKQPQHPLDAVRVDCLNRVFFHLDRDIMHGVNMDPDERATVCGGEVFVAHRARLS